MPYYEYECRAGHRFELFFKSFETASKYENETPFCPECTRLNFTQDPPQAKRVPSAPLGFGLYGDPGGYGKPSATKRFSTKLASRKDGNKYSGG